MKQSLLKLSHITAPVSVIALGLILSGCEAGVEGGASALTTRFGGITAVQAISPSSVTVTWTPQSGYSSYSVFSSSQDTPLVTLPLGSSYTVNGLQPNTTYSFSVVGTSSEGNQYGMAKQLQATTWGNFLGPTSATAIDGTSVALLWNYNSGPLYNVYVSTNPAPTISSGVPPKLLATPYTTSSQTGYTVSGLLPNTTYYFMAAAKFADGTDSLNLSLPSSATQSAVYVSKDPSLILEPLIVTAKTQLTTLQPIFTISNSVATLRATFEYLNNDGTTWTNLGQFSGNGNFTPSLTLPSGSRTIKITIRDLISNTDKATAVLDDILVTTISPSNALKIVSATTPSGLSPIPTVTTNAISLGSYPSFTISGAQPGYVTSIYDPDTNPDTLLATLTGNGTVKTLTSAPLSSGAHTLYALVSYGGLTARIDNINVRVKNIDSKPVPLPVLANGGIGNQGFGRSMAVGDYNCDGYPDLAAGAPYGDAVYVYYGSAAGLDYSATPVTNPAAGKPLYIPLPTNITIGTGSVSQIGTLNPKFGATLASGNFNGDGYPTPLPGGRPCMDLAVGVPGHGDTIGSTLTGSVVTYYGSSAGLQVATPLVNTFGCVGGGSNSCSPVMMRPAASGIVLGPAVPNVPYVNDGVGAALAAGDLNADGYDDLVASAPRGDYTTANAYRGFLLLYKGTGNGLAPSFVKVAPPAAITSTSTSNSYGDQMVIGNFNPSVRTAACGAGNEGARDLVITFRTMAAGSAGITNPTTQGGMIVVPGCKTTNYLPIDGSNLITQYTRITPPTCNTVAPVALPANWVVSGGISCGTDLGALTKADLNKDGYDDIIFSDPIVPSASPARGALYVYYGTNNAGNFTTYGLQSTVPSPLNACAAGNCPPQVFYLGDTNVSYFGFALGMLGDVDNDGYPDIGVGAVGAPSNGLAFGGRVHIYRGSATGLTTVASRLISPNKATKSYFGAAIAGAKFNSNTYFTDLAAGNPTYSDVVVGAVGDSPQQRSNGVQAAPDVGAQTAYGHGTISLFNNTAGIPAVATTSTAVLAPGNATLNKLGAERATLAGDVNGDGYADLLMPLTLPAPPLYTARAANSFSPLSPGTQTGMVIYSGSPTGFVTSEVVAGVPTLIAPSYNPIRPTDPLIVLDSYLPGLGMTDFAAASNAAGDLNGDGYGDVLTSDGLTSRSIIAFYGSANGLIVSPTPRLIPYDGSNRPSLDPMIVTAGNNNVHPVAAQAQPSGGGGWHYGQYFAIGDFNGDGYGDFGYQVNTVPKRIIVVYGSAWGVVGDGNLYVAAQGATYSAAPTTSRAQVTPNCTGTPQVCTPLLLPDTANDGICNIFTGGDMDGDGTDELVSANCDDSTFTPLGAGVPRRAGTVSIFYGSHSDGIHPDRRINLRIDIVQTAVPGGRYLGGPAIDLSAGYTAQPGHGGDINGDGLSDIILPSMRHNEVYVVYGVPGPGSSPTVASGAYIQQGLCASFPCTLSVTNVATADYAPNHVLTASASQPNSCSAALRTCNVLRFTAALSVPANVYTISTFGMGDITGDSFGDVVVSTDSQATAVAAKLGEHVIYSGSASGLQVTAAISTKPNCVSGLCDPMRITWPTTLPQYQLTSGAPVLYPLAPAWQIPGDVDGDGKNDILFSARYLNNADFNGVVNSISSGGFFLFH